MKFSLMFLSSTILLLLAVFSHKVTSYPAMEDLVHEEPLEEIHLRMRRATCDLFSFSSKVFTPNHSLCAAHCVALGKKGGRCKDAICHCRN